MQKENKITMKDRVLKYMQDFGSITTKQAFNDLGCCDLQHYIMVLREEYFIDSKWIVGSNRYGDKVQFKQYWIEYKYGEE